MTSKMEKRPAVVMDKEPEEKKVDPTLCQCTGVERRYDTDGLVETVDGVNWYQCSACGKKYR